MARDNILDMEDSLINEKLKKVDEVEQKKKMVAKRNEFNQRIDIIADKIIEFRERNAEEYLIEMLSTFLDVALDMRDLMDALEATSEGMQCIMAAIGFVDEILDFNTGMFRTSLEHNHSWWQRQKEKRQIKKAFKNNVGRMKTIADQMSSQVKFARTMMNEMKNVTTQLKKTTSKKDKKKKGAPAVSGRAEDYIQSRLHDRNAESGGNGESYTPTAKGGTDDISDIVG